MHLEVYIYMDMLVLPFKLFSVFSFFCHFAVVSFCFSFNSVIFFFQFVNPKSTHVAPIGMQATEEIEMELPPADISAQCKVRQHTEKTCARYTK